MKQLEKLRIPSSLLNHYNDYFKKKFTEILSKQKKITYKSSGVDVNLGYKLVDIIKPFAKKTLRKEIDSNIGSFAALASIPKNYKSPKLVACTDGVGTKIELANKFKKFDTIGIDLVAMCINDLIVQGAKPLFFLDYIAVGKLDLNKTKKILKGIFEGCRLSNCKLIGGETAEMPGTYSKNKFDVAGFSVGIVSKKKILSKKKVRSGDVVLAIPSNGLHSNGFSLVRSILKSNKIPLSLRKELLKPTKIYSKEILKLTAKNLIHSAAHITGGGLIENLTRSIPENLSLNVDLSKIKVNKIFKWLKSKNISDISISRACWCFYCIIEINIVTILCNKSII